MIKPTQQKIKCVVSLGKMKYKMKVRKPRPIDTNMIGPMQPISPFVQQAYRVKIENKPTEYMAASITDCGVYNEAIVATIYDSQRVNIPNKI